MMVTTKVKGTATKVMFLVTLGAAVDQHKYKEGKSNKDNEDKSNKFNKEEQKSK